jgi:hypothetical protein
VKKNKELPHKQIAGAIPIALVMETYLEHASDIDLEQADRILETIICAIDGLRSDGITGKQVTIAALSFARVMVLAQAEEVQSDPENMISFATAPRS